MKLTHTLSLTLPFIVLAACSPTIDTTGISKDTTKQPEGPASATVTVTEYGDFQCPACKSAYTLINQPIIKKYEGKIRFEFKNFPLRSIHQYAFTAAQAAECAADQGKFWEWVDTDYTHQEDLANNPYEGWAKDLGLNADLFHRCLASGIKSDIVTSEFNEGEKLGVNSTPSYFVNGLKVDTNTVEALSAAIDSALSQVNSAPL